MYKLNLIAVVSIVTAVSLFVGMASPAVAFAAQHENMTMTKDDNMSSMGNMTGGGNATSMSGNMTETESLTTAGETGDGELHSEIGVFFGHEVANCCGT